MKQFKFFVCVFCFLTFFCIQKSYSLGNFEDFRDVLRNQADYNVSLLDYENPLVFTERIEEPESGQIIGGSGAFFSRLYGQNNFSAFWVDAFSIMEFKFGGNIEFSSFSKTFNYSSVVYTFFEIGNFIFSFNSVSNVGGGVFHIYGDSPIISFLNSSSTFISNSANPGNGDHGGGAVYAYTSALKAENSSVTFANNYVMGDGIRYGGAVYANQVDINFKNTNSKWISNHLSQGEGAALYTSKSKVNFEGGAVDFSNNYVERNSENSSTFYSKESFVEFKNISARFFENNTGSAIGALDSTFTFLNAQTEFIGNVSPIKIQTSSLSFIGARAHFDKNRNVLNIQNSNVLFADISVDFTNSSGVFQSDNSTIVFRNSTALFGNNYPTIQAQKGAGAFYADTKTLLIFSSGSVIFADNIAYSEDPVSSIAGAVYVGGASSVNFISATVTFQNNSSDNPATLYPETYLAGALFINEGSTLNFVRGFANFSNNKNKTLFITGKSLAHFVFNTSVFSANDRAIIIADAKVIFLKSSSSFIDNSEAAISVSEGAIFDVLNSTLIFRNNKGAINLNDAVLVFSFSSASFIGNNAPQKGGAIYASKSTISFINAISPQTQITFLENTANDKPNDFYLEDSTMFLSGKISILSGIEALRSSITYSGELLSLGGENNFKHMRALKFEDGSLIRVQDGVFVYENNALLTLRKSRMDFIDSSVSFNENTGGGLYAENSTVSFVNGNIFFRENSGADIKAESSEINISADIEFSANESAHIDLEDSILSFSPSYGRNVKVKANIKVRGDNNVMKKTGEGRIVFDRSMPMDFGNVDILIEQGYAGFEIMRSTFNEMKVSAGGFLDISIDFAANTISIFYLDKLTISGGALSVVPINGHAAVIGTSLPFVYAESRVGTFDDSHISGGRYIYSFHWQPGENGLNVGYLRLDYFYVPPTDTSNAPFYADLRTVGTDAEFASEIRKGKDSVIVGKIGLHEVWSSINLKRQEYLGDRSDGNFLSSVFDFKAGIDLVQDGGVFMAYENITAGRGGYKAGGAGFEIGIYKIIKTEPIDIGAALSFNMLNFKVKQGSKVNSNAIKFSLEGDAKKFAFAYPKAKTAEQDKVFIPFAGIRGAFSMSGKIENENEWTMPADSFMVLDTLGGLKTGYRTDKLSLGAKLYLGFPIMNKPDFELSSKDGTKDVESTKDGKLFAGLHFDGEYEIDPAWAAFGGVSFEKSSEALGFMLTLGARYKLKK